LDWAELEAEPHRSLLDWYRALIALRHGEPDLTDPRLTELRVAFDETARWLVVRRGRVRIAVNLADRAQPVPLDGPVGEVLLASDVVRTDPGTVRLPPESVAILRIAEAGRGVSGSYPSAAREAY
jgi:maltooligosyltrehalose trehalohydrolase